MTIIKGSPKLFWWSVTGLVIIIVGILLAFVVFPLIIDDTIYKQVRLKNGTDQYERWRELPVTIEFNFYMFNVTNPYEVTFQGAYPNVTQLGPYYYKEFRVKRNITYDEEADTLTYVQYTHFEFDREKTHPDLSPDDKIWTLNAGLNAVLQIATRYIPTILMEALVNKYWQAMFLEDETNENMFHEVKVADLLFDGVKFCKPEKWRGTAGLICLFAALLDIKFLKLHDDFSMSFAYFAFKQDTHDGVITVNAGNKDVTKLGLMSDWNGYTYNNIWGDRYSHCNQIKGRDGTIYPPDIQEDQTFDVYSTEICRVGKARFLREQTLHGIKAHRRVLGREIYANPEEFPDNYCYCGKHEKDINGEKGCLPTGFRDLSQCHIAPVVVSNPHFLFADEEYSKTAIGMNPVQDDHETFLAVEPMTGTPLEGRKRMQFNMILRPVNGIDVTQNITPNVCPIAWVEEGVLIPVDLADQFKSLFHSALLAVAIIQWTVVAIGGLVFVICGGLYFYKLKKYGPRVVE